MDTAGNEKKIEPACVEIWLIFQRQQAALASLLGALCPAENPRMAAITFGKFPASAGAGRTAFLLFTILVWVGALSGFCTESVHRGARWLVLFIDHCSLARGDIGAGRESDVIDALNPPPVSRGTTLKETRMELRHSRRLGGAILSLSAFALGAVATPGPLSPEEQFSQGMHQVMMHMDAAMRAPMPATVDSEFVAMMVPHHQAAIDMAVLQLRYGHNPQLARIAQEIIVEQQQEITVMRGISEGTR
jgi:hypothetical protein